MNDTKVVCNQAKKLALVGSGSDTRDNAPWEDGTFTIWVMNEAPCLPWCKRWDASFQMHVPEVYSGPNLKYANYWEWLQERHGKPVYMQNADERVPDSVEFPIDGAASLIAETYLSFTGCYMAALAILQGFTEVWVYGFEMSVTEYQYQADCWRFWIGFLKGRLGAENVHIESGQHMFQDALYGYEGNFTFGKEYYQGRVDELDRLWKDATRKEKKAVEEIQAIVAQHKADKFPEAVAKYQHTKREAGIRAGALATAEQYLKNYETFTDRNGFERGAAEAQRDGEVKRILMYRTNGMIELIAEAWSRHNVLQAVTQLSTYLSRLGEQAYDLGAHEGKYQENQLYMAKYDSTAQANGGKVLQPVTHKAALALGTVNA